MHGIQPPNHVPLLGQQQAAARAQLIQAVQQMSFGIYSHVATAYIGTRDDHQAVDAGRLQQLARDSMLAARAYFEGLGMASFEDPTP